MPTNELIPEGPAWFRTDPLGDGKSFIQLDGYYAHDLDVINSARVSYAQHHKVMEVGDDKLINFLMVHRHGTPFEANFFKFHVKAPIFVFREWHRHRIGISINEQSARYMQLSNDFYIPKREDVRIQIGRPGHYTYEQAPRDVADTFIDMLSDSSKRSYYEYESAISLGIAKEQARMFLPVNIYSEMYWSANARSLMAFLSLRNSPRAQKEIQKFAQAAEDMFKVVMPITATSFIANNRVAP